MKYVILVSHGLYASGLKDALFMLSGEKEEVLALGLENGQTIDDFTLNFQEIIKNIKEDDEIILLGDLIGGSPLTGAISVLSEKHMLEKTTILGGMNLPLALTTVIMKDAFDRKDLVQQVLGEATGALKEFVVETQEEDEI